MEDSTTNEKETAGRTIEEISQILPIALGEGVVVCQVCGDDLREGARVSAFAFQRCPQCAWQVGQVRCVEHALSLESLASLGVREVVVAGRVGRCVDQARQCDWPVLLGAEVQSVSPRWSRDSIDVTNASGRCPLMDSAAECAVCAGSTEGV